MNNTNALADLGVNPATIRKNWKEAALYEAALRRGEGEVAQGGALVVKTGVHTGRSAKDKFTVRNGMTENTVWWDNNASMTEEAFDNLWEDFQKHMEGGDYFVQELFGGADLDHRIGFAL